ncbi:MAG: hypothetical protein ACLQMO_12455 [Acidobacteriaceae bacterium]
MNSSVRFLAESGRLDHLSVTHGETIDAGHPLFQLDNQPEADEVRQAEHLLRTSRSRSRISRQESVRRRSM